MRAGGGLLFATNRCAEMVFGKWNVSMGETIFITLCELTTDSATDGGGGGERDEFRMCCSKFRVMYTQMLVCLFGRGST